MKTFEVCVKTSIVVEADSAEEAVDEIQNLLSDYYLTEGDFEATEITDDEAVFSQAA